ncbi:MAG TPA: TlpA disulfide reductase family protein [Anaeromyxobacter sp.]
MRRAALAATLAAALVSCAGPRASLQTSPLLGRSVSLEANRLDGREERVPAPRAQATVVDFWATWCEPCRDQLPMLDRLHGELRERRVDVVAISFDEDRAALEEFLARIPVGFPVLWDKGGAALAVKMEITRLPTTVLLDREGVVRAVHLGFDRGDADALERDIRRVLDQQDQADASALR